MKKSELRKMIREEIQKLNEVDMYYDGEGKLTTLDKIDDVGDAIDWYKNRISSVKRSLPRDANFSDKQELFQFQDELKKLIKHNRSRK